MIGRLAWSTEVEPHAVPIGPMVELLRRELRPIVDADGLRKVTADSTSLCKDCSDLAAAEGPPGEQDHALSREQIDHGQDADGGRAGQRVVHEVHGPLLVASGGHRPAHANGGASMTPWPFELQTKPFQRVKPVHALVIHPPPFAAQV